MDPPTIYSGQLIDLSDFENARNVAIQLAVDRGGSVDEYFERLSIDVVDTRVEVTATGRDDGDAVDVANQAAEIWVKQFNAITRASDVDGIQAELTQPAR
ncbi:hypothetical protein [Rhodococcus sp. NBC_00294]|uniref:hypothetical protein n=1 Tax=Rhodococcus sp. NBC_00294 TaxID=2976004 RepID=UPI002E2DD65A|nr:hypothetical protein [Rhodococcus sp. NBC_00294]